MSELTHQDIAVKAYFISQQPGRQGLDLENWIEAEKQLRRSTIARMAVKTRKAKSKSIST